MHRLLQARSRRRTRSLACLIQYPEEVCSFPSVEHRSAVASVVVRVAYIHQAYVLLRTLEALVDGNQDLTVVLRKVLVDGILIE